MSKLLGRENVGVKSTDLKDGYIPRWNKSTGSWETVYFENQIEGLYSLDFNTAFLAPSTKYSRVALESAKIYLDNDGDTLNNVELTSFGTAYLETAPTNEITLEVHRVYNNELSDDHIANIIFDANSKTGVFRYHDQSSPPTVLNFDKGDRFYIKTPSDIYQANNLSVSIRTAILLPLGSSDPRIVILDEVNNTFTGFNNFTYTFDSNTTANESEAPQNQSFFLSASGLSTASDGVTISFQQGKFEVSSNSVDWNNSLVIPQSAGSIDNTRIFVRAKAGIVTYDLDEDFNNHTSGVVRSVTDTLEISADDVSSEFYNLTFVATIPAIYNSNNFVFKIKSDSNGAFSITGTQGVSNFTYRKVNQLFNPTSITSTTINITGLESNTDYLLEVTGLTKFTGNENILDVFNFTTSNLDSSLSGLFKNTKITEFKANNYPLFSANTDLSSCFEGAALFNDSSINNWDLSNVVNISKMFSGASSFNKPLPNWELNTDIKAGDPIFESSGMDQLNIDLTLTGWANKAIDSSKTFNENDLYLGFSLSTNDVSGKAGYNSHGLSPADQVKSSLNAALELVAKDLIIITPSQNNNIQLAENGVTIYANEGVEDASYNDINGIRYFVFVDVSSINENNADVAVTSFITDMSELFYDETSFNKDISHWDVSKVTTFYRMFKNCSSFNQDLRYWDVSSATTFQEMFDGANSFNVDISFWYNNNSANITDFIRTDFPEYKKPIFSDVNTNTLEENDTYTHSGYEYTVVKSPYTGRLWFNSDLRDANNNYFYQWGRSTDGHQQENSTTSSNQIGVEGFSDSFITNPNNWASTNNNNLWNKNGSEITNDISPKNWSPFRVEDIEDEIVGLLNNNLISYSEDFSNDAWVKTEEITINTETLENILDYDVTSSGINNNNANFSIKQSLYVSGSSNHVLSFYFNQINSFTVAIKNQAGSTIDNGNQSNSTAVGSTNWKRFEINFNTSNNVFIEIEISSTELNIFGVQLEKVDSSSSTATPYVYKEGYKQVTTKMLERSFLNMIPSGYRNKSDGNISGQQTTNYWLLNYNGNNDYSSKYFSVGESGTGTFGIGSAARSYGYAVRLIKENDYLLPYNIFVYKQKIVEESGYIAVNGREEALYESNTDFENYDLVCTFNAGGKNKLYALNTKQKELTS